jgi:hypothetical protein
MSTASLRRSVRHYGGPAVFLAAVCFLMGILFIGLASELGSVFMVAGLGALTVFALMGARDGD